MPTGMRPGQAGGLALLAQRGREYFVGLAKKSAAARATKLKNNTMVELRKYVAEIATRARNNASWSNDIPGAISIGEAGERDGNITCDILVDLGIAPQAAAFEYGSGIWGEKGKKYPIRAKDKLLAFQFSLSAVPHPEKFSSMAGITSDGMLAHLISVKGRVTGLTFWKMVEHPGVEARPYLEPAIQEVLPEMRKALGKAFREAVIQGVFNEA